MNRVVVACVGLLALAGGSAAAADLPRYYQPGPAYNAIYTWTGFYVGINGGGGWGRSQWDGVDTFDVSGGLIGATVGYNWQFGGTVIGAEGDIDWSGIKATTTVLCAPGCETRNKWLATARGRLGYGFDRFLPYFTGGLALGDINATRPSKPPSAGIGPRRPSISTWFSATSTAGSIAVSSLAATYRSPPTSFAAGPTFGSDAAPRHDA